MFPILGQKEQIFNVFSEFWHFDVVCSANQELKVYLWSIIFNASSPLFFIRFRSLRDFGTLIKDVILIQNLFGRIVVFRHRTYILVGQRYNIIRHLFDLLTFCPLFLGLLSNDVSDWLIQNRFNEVYNAFKFELGDIRNGN